MKSWKTTLGAALTAFGGGLAVIDPAWAKVGALIALAGTVLGLLFAADHGSVQSTVDKAIDTYDKTP